VSAACDAVEWSTLGDGGPDVSPHAGPLVTIVVSVKGAINIVPEEALMTVLTAIDLVRADGR
jgi:hypothetical protein